MVDLIFIGIIIVFYIFPSGVVKHVKIFCLKRLKIHLNTILETVVFGV